MSRAMCRPPKPKEQGTCPPLTTALVCRHCCFLVCCNRAKQQVCQRAGGMDVACADRQSQKCKVHAHHCTCLEALLFSGMQRASPSERRGTQGRELQQVSERRSGASEGAGTCQVAPWCRRPVRRTSSLLSTRPAPRYVLDLLQSWVRRARSLPRASPTSCGGNKETEPGSYFRFRKRRGFRRKHVLDWAPEGTADHPLCTLSWELGDSCWPARTTARETAS